MGKSKHKQGRKIKQEVQRASSQPLDLSALSKELKRDFPNKEENQK